MYLSLDRVDIELAARDGRKQLVQTDHRTPGEMRARRALSTIIVLVRCLNPRRAYPDLDLFYNCLADPPQFIVDAVAASGAHLWVGTEPSFLSARFPLLTPNLSLVDDLANAAFTELATELAQRTSPTSLLPRLERLEKEVELAGFPDEDDAVSFWTTIIELGALSGQAIHERNGGAWTYDPTATGTSPLCYKCTFGGEPATINPLGKALKFIRGWGGGDEPSTLVKMLATAAS